MSEVAVTLRFTSENYTDALGDPNSAEYKALEAESIAEVRMAE